MEEEDFVEKVAEATGISVECYLRLRSGNWWSSSKLQTSMTVGLWSSEFMEAITMLKQANDDFASSFTIVDNLLGNQISETPESFTNRCLRAVQEGGTDPHHAPEAEEGVLLANQRGIGTYLPQRSSNSHNPRTLNTTRLGRGLQ